MKLTERNVFIAWSARIGTHLNNGNIEKPTQYVGRTLNTYIILKDYFMDDVSSEDYVAMYGKRLKQLNAITYKLQKYGLLHIKKHYKRMPSKICLTHKGVRQIKKIKNSMKECV